MHIPPIFNPESDMLEYFVFIPISRRQKTGRVNISYIVEVIYQNVLNTVIVLVNNQLIHYLNFISLNFNKILTYGAITHWPECHSVCFANRYLGVRGANGS